MNSLKERGNKISALFCLIFEMLIIKYGLKLLVLVGIFLLFTVGIFAQNKTVYSVITVNKETGKQMKPIDLTLEVNAKCSQSIVRKIGNSTLEVRFPISYFTEATAIADALEKALLETQNLLLPFSLNDVRFYLLQSDNPPQSYEINSNINSNIKNNQAYTHLFVFKNKNEINFECRTMTDLCRNIYFLIPHELTHTALENLIDNENSRWFREGFAEYIGTEVLDKLNAAEKDAFSRSVVLPKIFLHRAEIRRNLLGWTRDFDYPSTTFYYYQASLQLIRLIMENAKINGMKEPVRTLLQELLIYKQKNTIIKTNILIDIIKQKLKVDPTKLGILKENEQKELVAYAIEKLDFSESDALPLLILASIDEVELPNVAILKLLKKIYEPNRTEAVAKLAATALAIRINNSNVEKEIQIFSQKSNALKNKNLTNIKKDLKRLSTRPNFLSNFYE